MLIIAILESFIQLKWNPIAAIDIFERRALRGYAFINGSNLIYTNHTIKCTFILLRNLETQI